MLDLQYRILREKYIVSDPDMPSFVRYDPDSNTVPVQILTLSTMVENVPISANPNTELAGGIISKMETV